MAQKIGSFWILNILKVLKYLCGIAWEVEGLSNLPNKPFVMLANHQGPWESLFLQTLVIPICHNSGVHWKNRSLRKQPGKISVVIGPPITGSDPKEITNQAHAWIKKTYERIS